MKPQEDAVHVAVLLAGWAQVLHRFPHEATASFETQVCPHACSPVGHEQVPEPHVAPIGQSLVSRQPVRQRLVTGSQKKPAPQPMPLAVQSSGSTAHCPRLHTWPWPQSRPHVPQFSGSAERSRQRVEQKVRVPAHGLG